jgi:hypothetical protein
MLHYVAQSICIHHDFRRESVLVCGMQIETEFEERNVHVMSMFFAIMLSIHNSLPSHLELYKF